jgi:hypothetical protein
MQNPTILHLQGRGRIRTALLATILLTSTTAWAGRPLVTEDAGVLAQKQCEWESFLGRQTEPGVTLGATQIGCGIGGNTQVALGTSYERTAQGTSTYTILAGKTAFGSGNEALPRMALAYTLLSGREQTDYLNYTSAEIKGVLTVPYGAWLLHANAGLLHSHQDHASVATWAIAAERPNAIGRIDLMGEIYGDNKNSPWLQVAARWAAIPEKLYFDASYGIHAGGTHSHLATIGMKLAF